MNTLAAIAIKTRVAELDKRVDEIMGSDRPARVKLIRVTHIRKELEILLARLPELTNADNH